MTHTPRVIGEPGQDFIISSDEVMSTLGNAPVSGITEYRSRGNMQK